MGRADLVTPRAGHATKLIGTLPVFLVFALPLMVSVWFCLAAPFDLQSLLDHPQFPGAFVVTLATGLASTVLSLVLALVIIARMERSLSARAGAFLSLPHLSFAIGFGFLIMPAGLLTRILALPFGWTTPPAWVTTQDPWGLALIVVLVLKETPFLVWALASILNREDLRLTLRQQCVVAASLGHSRSSSFLRVMLPQILPVAVWPLVAVLAYGLTVVDMALVIGPTQPPTLAQLVWTDLNDSEPASNARGVAGVLVLAGLILSIVVLAYLALLAGRPLIAQFWSKHPGKSQASRISPVEGQWIWAIFLAIYGAVALTLFIQSFATLWPFPRLVPDTFSISAWARVMRKPEPILTSLLLALSTSFVSLVATVAWFEAVSPRRDRWLMALAAFSLCLPSLVIGLGQYRLFLLLGVAGTPLAMFLAHVLPVAAYVLVMLQGSYRGFDERYRAVSSGLRASRWHFLTAIKWPLLKAPLLSAFAVGFAVSIAQYVPAQLAAAGRYTTLPMEAVTLTAGGNRSLTAAFGLLLMVFPLVVFIVAGRLGRSRWSQV